MILTPIDYQAEEAPTDFVRSLHRTGFAVLRQTPISSELVQRTYEDWAAFFRSEHKHSYTFDPQLQSGYFPFQSEQAKGYTVPDLKEFFHLYAWSELPEGMSDRSWQLFAQLRHLAAQLLGWIETESPPRCAAGLHHAPQCHDCGQSRNLDAPPSLSPLGRAAAPRFGAGRRP